MNKLVAILYSLKILKLNFRKIDHWIETKQFEKLSYASKKGNYKIRLRILETLGQLNNSEMLLPIDTALIDDKVQVISEQAMNILKDQSHLSQRISEKELFWSEKQNNINTVETSNQNSQTWKQNKKGMVRLNQVKQQLKKSMYGEKWM